MLVSSVLRPNTDMWRQQWDTRLPGEIVARRCCSSASRVCSTVLGVGLAWLVSAPTDSPVDEF